MKIYKIASVEMDVANLKDAIRNLKDDLRDLKKDNKDALSKVKKIDDILERLNIGKRQVSQVQNTFTELQRKVEKFETVLSEWKNFKKEMDTPTRMDVEKRTKGMVSASVNKSAKLSWPIIKEKPNQNDGIWEQWMSKKINDSKFVDLIMHLVDQNFTGITEDKHVRNGILNAIQQFKKTKDAAITAKSISAWLSAGKNVNEEMVREKSVRQARLDSVYNIYKITETDGVAREDLVKYTNGNPVEIKADSSEQAILFAKKQFSKLNEWENEYSGRTLVARLNKEKMQELEKYRANIEELRRKKEERAQSIYD